MNYSLKSVVLMLITAFSMSSCSSLFMANPCIDPIVFTKPAYRDSAFVSNYIGGKFNKSEYYSAYEVLTDNYFGQLYCFQTQTNKYYNLSYGAFGYYGKVGVEKDFTTNYKDFYGGGGLVPMFRSIYQFKILI